jgi:transposase-like protein
MVGLTAAARATLLALTCPHCGHTQARVRKPRGAIYACQKCHRRFSREAGMRKAK